MPSSAVVGGPYLSASHREEMQKHCSDALSHQALWDTSIQVCNQSSPPSEGTQTKPPRCVIIDSPDVWRHHSVTAFISFAFILIWVISLLVSEHHSSFPFLQAFKQTEDIQDRSQPINVQNTKITQQVTYIFWTCHCTDVQMQLLWLAQEEE